MKKLVIILAAILINATLLAQSPDKMSYQAVIRNSSNQLVTNTQVGMKISIMKNAPNTGILVYQEIQTPTTNANGLVSLEIGGNYTGFDTIHWANGPYFIKTETDPTGGTNYTIMGSSELLSVPYALHSKTAESVTGAITETDPVYGASPAAGITGTNITNWNNNMLPSGSSHQTLYYDGISWVPSDKMKNWGTHIEIVDLFVDNSFGIGAPSGISPMNIISTTQVNNLNVDMLDGKHASEFLTSFTETDPVFGASPAAGITNTDITNWNNAALPVGLYGQTLHNNGTTWIPSGNLYNDGFHVEIERLSVQSEFTSQTSILIAVPQGIKPFMIWSSTKVDSLNADLLDGNHAADFSLNTHTHGTGTVNNIPKWNSTSTFGNSLINDNGVSIGIGTASPNASAKLEVNSTTQGFLPPRMSQIERDAITPTEGLIIYNTSSKKPNYYDGTSWMNFDGTSAGPPIAIGDTCFGGVVAYILQPGDPGYDANVQHGLIAAMSDQSAGAAWGCFGTTIGTSEGIGTGSANTNAIVLGCAEPGIAARLCADLILNTFDDWFLPSLAELNLMDVNLHNQGLGGFANNFYRSSTEQTGTEAWGAMGVDFSSGSQVGSNKSDLYHVRAARYF